MIFFCNFLLQILQILRLVNQKRSFSADFDENLLEFREFFAILYPVTRNSGESQILTDSGYGGCQEVSKRFVKTFWIPMMSWQMTKTVRYFMTI